MSSYTLQNAQPIRDQAKLLENIKKTESITKWIVFDTRGNHIQVVRGNGTLVYDHISSGACEGCLVFASMSGTLRIIYNDEGTGIPNESTGILLRSENDPDLEKIRRLLKEYVSNVV